MRKLYTGALLFLLLITSLSYGHSPVNKITQNYFRPNVFHNDFNTLLTPLLNDPGISNNILEKRMDSNFFYFQGKYTNYNPFFFKPTRLDVILTESPVEMDSAVTGTIYTYQLLAYDSGT